MTSVEEPLEGAGTGGGPETASADEVTSEFVAGVEQPSSSVNGHGAAGEPPLADSPEVVVGAAFLGGFLLGKLMRRLGS